MVAGFFVVDVGVVVRLRVQEDKAPDLPPQVVELQE